MTSKALLSAQHPAGPRKVRNLGEWFWRGQALRQAKRAMRERPALVQARLRHALAAAELASRATEAVEPLKSEPGYWIATLLYREAAYWALLAQDEAVTGNDLAAVFAASPRSLLIFASDGAEGLEAVESVLLKKESAQLAEDDVETQRADAALARGFVEALIRLELQLTERVDRVLIERWVRTGSALLLGIAAVVGALAAVRHMTRPLDLAYGKPWRTSSSQGECRPQQRTCLGVTTNILFHTTTEAKPWFEVDLGRPSSFSVVEVENRGDCCPDRALPLVLEVSDDAQQWREVARRTESFDTWRAELSPQTARYVRARALKTTALHLVGMSVYER